MQPHQPLLTQLLDHNPSISAAWLDTSTNPPTLNLVADTAIEPTGYTLPPLLAHLPRNIIHGKPLRTREAPLDNLPPANVHQECFNEPLPLGVQIQPRACRWVGTAGAPVSWTGTDGEKRYGFLSNAHVMVPRDQAPGHPQHQPTDSLPAIGFLDSWILPEPSTIYQCDAAIADAWLDGFHTIATGILRVGLPQNPHVDATIGLAVIKAGRTTGVTLGQCVGVGASVKVDYGDYIATLEDQDIFQREDGPFSAPGDSGSLILTEEARHPSSLLFAGNDTITVGSPMRHILAQLDLDPNWP